jgi:hypothetical protein
LVDVIAKADRIVIGKRAAIKSARQVRRDFDPGRAIGFRMAGRRKAHSLMVDVPIQRAGNAAQIEGGH